MINALTAIANFGASVSTSDLKSETFSRTFNPRQPRFDPCKFFTLFFLQNGISVRPQQEPQRAA